MYRRHDNKVTREVLRIRKGRQNKKETPEFLFGGLDFSDLGWTIGTHYKVEAGLNRIVIDRLVFHKGEWRMLDAKGNIR